MIALGVKLKCLANDRRTLFIYDDRFITRVIDISNWSQRRIFAPSHFLAQSSFSIFGKRIYIVFALPKSDVQHKFSCFAKARNSVICASIDKTCLSSTSVDLRVYKKNFCENEVLFSIVKLL